MEVAVLPVQYEPVSTRGGKNTEKISENNENRAILVV